MTKSKIALLFTMFISASSFCQKYGKEETNLSSAYRIDSSDIFLIPKIIDYDDKNIYGKGKGYLSFGNYSDILFYNAKTNTIKKLFGGQLTIIFPFLYTNNYYDKYNYTETPKKLETPINILENHIVYLARTDNFNGDNALDTDDPTYLYLTTKTGENLKQITPKGFHVLSWQVYKDKNMILVKGKNDKNNNKKFGEGDDEIYYRIDLDDDILKVKCYQITF